MTNFNRIFNQLLSERGGPGIGRNRPGGPRAVSKRSGISVFDKHQLKIAKSTLKMSDAGANIMGGMNKEEARLFLISQGWALKKIAKLEEAASDGGISLTSLRTKGKRDKYGVPDSEIVKDKNRRGVPMHTG